MKNLRKIIFIFAAILTLSVFTVACEKEPTVSKDELVYPVDLKAELKEGITYTADTEVNFDDFTFTLIFNDGSEKVIPSSAINDYADVKVEDGTLKITFTYEYDEEKLLEELKAEKKAEENKEELKANASTNWDTMTDAEKKVVWNDLSLSEKEEIVKAVYADEIASTEPLEGASVTESFSDPVNKSNFENTQAGISYPDGSKDYYGVELWCYNLSSMWGTGYNIIVNDYIGYPLTSEKEYVACCIICGDISFDAAVSYGAPADELASVIKDMKADYYVNILDYSI